MAVSRMCLTGRCTECPIPKGCNCMCHNMPIPAKPPKSPYSAQPV